MYKKSAKIINKELSLCLALLVYISYSRILHTYDLCSPMHNALDACISITRASARGLGPGNLEFLGPHNGYASVQHYAHGCINHRCIGGFMHKKPTREVSGPILVRVEEQVKKGT
jgi:hypothetical protein